MIRTLSLAIPLALAVSCPNSLAASQLDQPQWQRVLQGDNARKAAKLEEQIARLREAGAFAEAVAPATALSSLRERVQGHDHWQAEDARQQVKDYAAWGRLPEDERNELAAVTVLLRQEARLTEAGKHREAYTILVRILAIRRKLLGREHPNTATSLSNVAEKLCELGKIAEAEQAAQEALAIYRKVLSARHPRTATSYNNMATFLHAMGRYGDAEEQLQQALSIRREVLGEENAQTASSYNNLAAILQAQGKYLEAGETYQRALAINRKVFGEEHPATATNYNNLASILGMQGKYPEAAEGYQKALAIHRKVRGEEHPDTARSHNNVATNLDRLSRHLEAEQSHRKALAIYGKVYGDDHPLTATSYNNLAANLRSQGKYTKAEECVHKALAIRRKLFGEEHSATAQSYNNLAAVLADKAQYTAAEQVHRMALAIYGSVLDEDHPLVASSYNNIGTSLQAQGKYAEAAVLLQKALAIRRRVLGEQHPATARSYNNLAVNLNAQGRFAEAGDWYQKSLAVRRKLFGDQHTATANAYNNLAYTLQQQGKYVEAKEGYRRALTIFRNVLGEHPSTANCYNNMGTTLSALGKSSAAETMLRKGLAIRRKVLGEEHPETARSYDGLAVHLLKQGDYASAEAALHKALTINLKVFGREHPVTATSHNTLGSILYAQGKYAEAEKEFHTTLVIDRKLFGEEHLHTASSYNNLAGILHAQGRFVEAEDAFAAAVAIDDVVRIWAARAGSERAFADSFKDSQTGYIAVLARNGKTNRAAEVLEQHLARGLLDDLAGRQRAIPRSQRVRRLELVAFVRSTKQTIAAQRAKQGPESAQIINRLIQQELTAKSALASLARVWDTDYGVAVGNSLSLDQIQQALPDDGALVCWLDFQPVLPNAADPNAEHWAFLLRSTGRPFVVRLPGSGDGGAWTDDDYQAPTRLRQSLLNSRISVPRQQLAALTDNRFAPLCPYLMAHDGLPAVRQLVVLPSSFLAGLPVELLAPKATLVSYAPSGSLLAHLRELPRVASSGLLALGDPRLSDDSNESHEQALLPPSGLFVTHVLPNSNAAQHGLKTGDVLLSYDGQALVRQVDLKPRAAGKPVSVEAWRNGRTVALIVSPGRLGVAIANEPAPKAMRAERELKRWLRATRSGSETFDPLPGTFCEVQGLVARFTEADRKAIGWVGSAASEPNLARLAVGKLKDFRYLHFATHGVIDNQRPARSALILSQVGLPDPAAQFENGLPVFDGRVTVEEIVEQWELDADLVVLSACDTALGRYASGEGFMGFSQALLLAGARSVVLSLWKVDDTATMLLMDRFYANLLGQREVLTAPMSKAEALAEAKTWLRELSAKDAARRVATLSAGVARGKGRLERPATDRRPSTPPPAKLPDGDQPFSHPYYWAAFILIGDPA